MDDIEKDNGWETKNIYLRKGDDIIGLHAVGIDNMQWDLEELDGTRIKCQGFQAIDKWGNVYNEAYEMQGRGSFRVHQDIEKEAQEFEADGWVRFERAE